MKFAFLLIWALNTNQQITVPGIVDVEECQRLSAEISKIFPDQKGASFLCVPYQVAK
jgi:hypothetical protein